MSVVEREKRVGLQLPVEVHGEDIAGAAFRETTHSVNVSGGGICFETGHQLAIGARLRLVIDLPPALRRHFGNQPVYRAQAVVCRVEPPSGAARSRVGARFLADAGA